MLEVAALSLNQGGPDSRVRSQGHFEVDTSRKGWGGSVSGDRRSVGGGLKKTKGKEKTVNLLPKRAVGSRAKGWKSEKFDEYRRVFRNRGRLLEVGSGGRRSGRMGEQPGSRFSDPHRAKKSNRKKQRPYSGRRPRGVWESPMSNVCGVRSPARSWDRQRRLLTQADSCRKEGVRGTLARVGDLGTFITVWGK